MKEIEKLKPFTKFLMTIGELPSSYLISMTYEEQLLWFCNFLQNQVIPVVNNNSEAVIELQEYIKNYFDNLDVQEEINQKLDDMAESGELGDIISQYITTDLIRYKNNINELKLTEVTNGELYNVLGKNEINDGEGGLYLIKERQPGDIESDSLIILNENQIASKINKYAGLTTRKMYGIRNNACINNINNTGISAQVMGFHNDNELATYANRDHVIEYKEFRTQEPNIYAILSVTETTVTLSSNPSNVFIGSIIDLYENNSFNKNNKYSGFVTNVENNVITVNHWYLTGHTETGQVPEDVSIAAIDMPTKVWVNNDNVILQNDSNVKEGVIGEYGLLNQKDSSCKANGIDVVSLDGNIGSDFAFQARSSSDHEVYAALLALNTAYGLCSRNNTYPIGVQDGSGNTLFRMDNYGGLYYTNNASAEYIIKMANNLLSILGNGQIENYSVVFKNEASNKQLDTSKASVFILTGSNSYTISNGHVGQIVKIYSRSALNNLTIGSNTYALPQYKGIELIWVGDAWQDITGNLYH